MSLLDAPTSSTFWTSNTPFVSVPVLSKTTVLTFAKASK